MSENLVEVKHLQQYFPAGGMGKNKQYVQAVDDVSFAIRKGETLGLVGESGCGKTTTGRTLLRLYEPTDGTIIYDGKVLFDKKEKIAVDMLPYRRRMQIVFQDPYASLDPRMTIGDIVGEGIDIHHLCANAKERHDKIISLLERVGLNSEHANRYPHEFSGGQRQRIAVARALMTHPDLIVCDEPVSALDASVQAQILNLLRQVQEDFGPAYLFISHDLAVEGFMCPHILVMYLGRFVEEAGGQVGAQYKIAFLHLHETGNGAAVEAHAVLQGLGQVAGQHGDVLLGAKDIAESKAHEFDVVVLHEVQHVLLGRITHKDLLSNKTPKGLPPCGSRSSGWCKK